MTIQIRTSRILTSTTAPHKRVTPPPPPPPPTPPPPSPPPTPTDLATFAPNLPNNMTVRANTTFSSDFPTVQSNTGINYINYGGYQFSVYTINNNDVLRTVAVSDNTTPSGTGYSLRTKQGTFLNKNNTSAGYLLSGKMFNSGVPSTSTELYCAFTIKCGSPFLHEESSLKIMYPKLRVDGAPKNGGILEINPSGSTKTGPYRLRLTQNGTWNGTRYTQPNITSTVTHQLDTWVRVEFYYKCETPGLLNQTQDGIGRVWVSTWNNSSWSTPTQVINATNLLLGGQPSNSSKVFNNAGNHIDLYRGGGGLPPLTEDNFVYIDRILFATN